MILSESEVSIYAPSVTLTGDALLGALLLVQSIIESPLGANRPLEVTEFTEIDRVNYRQQSYYLDYSPILDDPTPVISVRIGNEINKYNQGIPVQDWQLLGENDYIIDYPLGRINLNLSVVLERFGWYDYLVECYTEAKTVYNSGFDFNTSPLSKDAQYIKLMTGNLLSYLTSPNYQGVKKLTVPFREFEIEYNNSNVGEIPQSLLLPFWKYRAVIV